MPEEPRPPRRRSRGGRRRGARPQRPQQAPAQPERAPALRDPRRGRVPAREARDTRADQRPGRRGTRARPVRAADEIRPGTPCVILLDCREGEPDRTGQPASFEGFFDFETGELRRPGTGIPRLRVGEERLWGFECWWRLDPPRAGLTESDRTEIEDSKRLLRGLMRDARRSTRVPR
jgi:hypothetical protein